MSASREKKIRQELASQGIPDIKEIRAAEEKQKQRRSNWLYGILALIFVVGGISLALWNSQVFQRSTPAVTVGDETFSAAEVEYYYHTVLHSISSSTYAPYMSLDTSLPLTQQVMTDSDYLFLNVTKPEGVEEQTWYDFIVEQAKHSLVQLTSLLQGAKEENFGFTEEMELDMENTMTTLGIYALQNGMSVSAYIKAMYGDTMNMDVLDKIMRENTLAYYYEQSKLNALTYTDAEVEAYYQANKDSFDVVNCDYIYFKGVADYTTDADGKSVAPTDAQNAAALEAAKNAANDALNRYKNGETDMKALADDYSIGHFYADPEASYYGDTVTEWLFEEGRKNGEVAVLESDSYYYLVRFNSRSRLDYKTVDARHILVKINTTGLDSTAPEYQNLLATLKSDALAKAEDILKEWKSGAATAESFGELANAKSDDTGSKTTGGLYTQIYKGQMVAPFEEWCFDAERKVGDTGIVFAESSNYIGYHVIYFQGFNESYAKILTTATMTTEAHNAWSDSMMEGLEAKELRGMKYVG